MRLLVKISHYLPSIVVFISLRTEGKEIAKVRLLNAFLKAAKNSWIIFESTGCFKVTELPQAKMRLDMKLEGEKV